MTVKNICNNCQLISTNGHDVVVSYGTPVLSILDRGESGKMYHTRHWAGWSATTQRHINKALDMMPGGNRYGKMNKATWEKMTVENVHS